VVVAAIIGAAYATPATAHLEVHSDPRDMSGRLDVARIRLRHGERWVRAWIEFHEEWTVRYFRNSDCGADHTGNDLCLGFDTNGSQEDVDRLVHLKYRNGGLRACLYWAGRCRAWVGVARTDSRTLRFQFHRSDWGSIRASGVVRWGGQLNDTRTGVNDYFPDGYRDGSLFRHDVTQEDSDCDGAGSADPDCW
jgi:hypothetical protein